MGSRERPCWGWGCCAPGPVLLLSLLWAAPSALLGEETRQVSGLSGSSLRKRRPEGWLDLGHQGQGKGACTGKTFHRGWGQPWVPGRGCACCRRCGCGVPCRGAAPDAAQAGAGSALPVRSVAQALPPLHRTPAYTRLS